jgi:hypothetical protein
MPNVWNKISFIIATTPPAKRTSLAGIDRQLDLFHSHSGSDETYDIHIFYLVAILNVIQAYRVSKAAKVITPNLQNRFNQVDLLERQVFERLRFEHFGKKKAAAAAAGPYNNIPLQAGYSNERTHFLAMKGRLTPKSKILNPYGGSFMHQTTGAATAPALQAHGVTVSPQMNLLLQKNFATLTLNEYKSLWKQLPKGDQNPWTAHNASVHFARKEERIRDHMIYTDAGLYYKDAGTPYGTNAWNMYAMDKYGNMMVAPSNHSAHGGQYNHSSLNAGNDVTCAGEVRIQVGQITYLNNNSGHYAPNRFQIHECIQCLVDDEQADLSLCTLIFYDVAANVYRQFVGTAGIMVFYNNVLAAGAVVAAF